MSTAPKERVEAAGVVFIGRVDLDSLIRELARELEVLCPHREGDALVLSRVDPEAPVAFEWNEHRADTSLRAVWHKPRNVLVHWRRGRPHAGAAAPSRVVVGAKACDLVALECLDRVFREHDYQEPAYCAARDATFVVSGDCTSPAPACFCTMLEGAPHPTSGYDLNLSPVADGYLVDIGSDAGWAVVEGSRELFSVPEEDLIRQRDRRREEIAGRVREQNRLHLLRDALSRSVEKNLKTAIWGELAATCVECNACNYVCPTCHCFLLTDSGDADQGARASVWDSCFHAGHARMAGGGTPRLQLVERFKNHYFHKFVSFPRNWGLVACCGCGRCIDACLGGIDKRACLYALETRWLPTEAAEVR